MINVENGFCCIKNKEYTLLDSKEEDNIFYFYRNDKRVIRLEEIEKASKNFSSLYELYVNNYLYVETDDELILLFKTVEMNMMRVTVKKLNR